MSDPSNGVLPIKQRERLDLTFPPRSVRLPAINTNHYYETVIEEETEELDVSKRSGKSLDQNESPPLKLPSFNRHDSSFSVTTASDSPDGTIEDDFITFDEEEDEINNLEGKNDKIREDDEQLELWKKSVALTSKEEKEIERTVRKECMEEFRTIIKETQEKQAQIKKHFKKVIEEARRILVSARVQAEVSSVVKLEEITEQKQEEIYLARERRKAKLRKPSARVSEDTMNYKDWVRSRVSEMDTLRKLQSNLDRARARRRNSIAAGVTVDKNGNVDLKRLAAMELRRLEKVKDIQTLVDELRSIGLEDKAIELQNCLEKKSEFEITYTKALISEKKKARNDANERKREEMEKMRRYKLSEKYAEKVRLERERREREELERKRRMEEAMKRREFNLKLKHFYNETRMETSISRSYRFSYF